MRDLSEPFVHTSACPHLPRPGALSEGMALTDKAGLKQSDLVEVLGLGAMACPLFAMKVGRWHGIKGFGFGSATDGSTSECQQLMVQQANVRAAVHNHLPAGKACPGMAA